MRKFLFFMIAMMSLMNVSIYMVHRSRIVKVPSSTIEESAYPEKQIEPIKPVQPKTPERVPEFVVVPVFRKAPEDSIYGDVISHCESKPYGDAHGRSTNSHETGHGIHSYIRNKYTNELKKPVNGFYCLEGRGVIIDEPKMRKSDINKFVPESLRSYRFKTYLEGQTAWDDMPLYIYDEWSAYVLGGMTNIEDIQKGRHNGEWSDGVSGCLDFSIYAIALCMAVKEHDPEYWESNTQFKNFTIWMLKRAQKTYLLGHKLEQLKWDKQDILLNKFLISSEAADMRKFVKENLDGVWLDTDPNVLKAIQYRWYQMLGPKSECRGIHHK